MKLFRIIKYIRRVVKLGQLFWNPVYRRGLFYGVAAAVEHERLIKELNPLTVIDIGANKGQFSLVSAAWCQKARIFAFEPLLSASKTYNLAMGHFPSFTLHQVALGSVDGESQINISMSDDSSSILPISEIQESCFPGTSSVGVQDVKIRRLDEILSEFDIIAPALLKLDIQGYELEALKGAVNLLHCVEWIYVEVSFEEFYAGQPLASEVFRWLEDNGFGFIVVNTLSKSASGRPVQADFLFKRSA